ncbi:hypothetical protein ACFWXK_20595 [Streptomyces sp. NPDC059070]|uniref:hypothetical protein n=1 Tax=Streptomyces sp. NPDC059070 TaxID=3346713 RepID=UPI003679F524
MPAHFHIGLSDDHGVVARATPAVSAHLAHWYLTAEQFDPVPAAPGLYRLAGQGSDRDARRRGAQAVRDLRRAGFTVDADYALAPAPAVPTPQPARRPDLAERRARIARAAARTPSAHTAPHHEASPAALPLPAASAVHSVRGQSR